jgi:acid phosphatase
LFLSPTTMKLFLPVALFSSFGLTAIIQNSEHQRYISQTSNEANNILKYLGGNGPYIEKPGHGISRDPPEGCRVDQVISMLRHGERFPQAGEKEPIETSLNKVREANVGHSGPLGFLPKWKYFGEDPAVYEQISYSGPYAGNLDIFRRGADYRARYDHLWDKKSMVPIFTGNYERCIDAARTFGEGFLSYNYSTLGALNIISEREEAGANSLAPVCRPGKPREGDCQKTSNSHNDYVGYIDETFPQAKVAAQRLNTEYPGLNLTSYDIESLMLLASYELSSKSSSPWFNVFTQEEWIGFEYHKSLYFYYCAGPGFKWYVPTGSVYVNATRTLLNDGPEEVGEMFWNFSHDTDITPILALLGIGVPPQNPPLDGNNIPFGQYYSISEVCPMGTHFTIERLNCDDASISGKGIFVRFVLNDSVEPLPHCQDGPGFSCRLDKYNEWVDSNVPSYAEACDIPSNWTNHLNFWWNWERTNRYNYVRGMIDR